MSRIVLVLSIAGVAMIPAACNSGRKEGVSRRSKPQLVLYCGAGLRPPTAELVDLFAAENGVEVAVDYAGSETLLSRIKVSRRGDLYMPGDQHYVEQAQAEGMILDQQTVCYFVPAILIRKGCPYDVRGLGDLLQEGLKLGVGSPEACAVGRTTREIFAKNGIPWEQVERKAVFQSATVNELGGHIKTGALDAVVVWDAIARYYTDSGRLMTIPPQRNVISTVSVGVLRFTEHPELARKFLELAGSPRGRDVFRKHNYTVDPPA